MFGTTPSCFFDALEQGLGGCRSGFDRGRGRNAGHAEFPFVILAGIGRHPGTLALPQNRIRQHN